MFKRTCKWTCLLVAGGILLQAMSCVDLTAELANVASIVTAGGVIWLVRKISQ